MFFGKNKDRETNRNASRSRRRRNQRRKRDKTAAEEKQSLLARIFGAGHDSGFVYHGD